MTSSICPSCTSHSPATTLGFRIGFHAWAAQVEHLWHQGRPQHALQLHEAYVTDNHSCHRHLLMLYMQPILHEVITDLLIWQRSNVNRHRSAPQYGKRCASIIKNNSTQKSAFKTVGTTPTTPLISCTQLAVTARGTVPLPTAAAAAAAAT